MEMHLVHKDARGAVTVVAAVFDKGTANTELDKLWAAMPEKAGQDTKITARMDLNAFLPADKSYWRFSGFLTPLFQRRHQDCPQTSPDTFCRTVGKIQPYHASR